LSERTEYQRKWRQNNPEKVRKNRQKSYWNNPEKYRKKAREIWHKNKGSTTTGKTLDKIANQVELSPTLNFKMNYIRKHAKDEVFKTLDKRFSKTNTLYQNIRKQVDGYSISIISLLQKTKNPTHTQIEENQKKYDLLKFGDGIQH